MNPNKFLIGRSPVTPHRLVTPCNDPGNMSGGGKRSRVSVGSGDNPWEVERGIGTIEEQTPLTCATMVPWIGRIKKRDSGFHPFTLTDQCLLDDLDITLGSKAATLLQCPDGVGTEKYINFIDRLEGGNSETLLRANIGPDEVFWRDRVETIGTILDVYLGDSDR